jgi:hypothetical protein
MTEARLQKICVICLQLQIFGVVFLPCCLLTAVGIQACADMNLKPKEAASMLCLFIPIFGVWLTGAVSGYLALRLAGSVLERIAYGMLTVWHATGAVLFLSLIVSLLARVI